MLVIGIVLRPTSGCSRLAYGLVPVAVVVGVLRYRLLGIEVVLRRTLLYVPLTLLVALVVGGLTTALARLVPEGPLPLLVASAVVAVLVLPGRRPAAPRWSTGWCWASAPTRWPLVDRVGAGLEAAATSRCPRCWRRSPWRPVRRTPWCVDAGRPAARPVGTGCGATLDVALRHSGEELGVLRDRTAARRAPRDRAGRPAGGGAGAAPRGRGAAQRLTAELGRERERVTVATLAERDRLRRDLHDGLGPSLSGIALGLEAAAKELGPQPRRRPSCSTAPGRRRSRPCVRSGGCSTGCGRAPSTSTASEALCARPRPRWAWASPGGRDFDSASTCCRCCRPRSRRRRSGSSPSR